MISPARAENQVLICVARLTLDAEHKEQMRDLLRGNLDWDYLLTMASRHGMVPLLYFHLNSLDADISAPVIAQLRNHNHELLRSNLSLTGELVRLIELLESHGIQAVPFKGPTLALQAYGEIGLRQFIDLDVLVRKTDVTKVRKLLVDRGFKPKPELTPAQEAALLRFDCAYTFVAEHGVVLDVHWDFVERHFSFDSDTNGLWDRLKPVTVGGKRLLTVSTEDLLLILCIHGFTHSWARLGWICDVAGLIDRQRDINWMLVLQNASRVGNRRILSLGLILANELLEARIPPEVLKTVQADCKVTKLARQLHDRLFVERNSPVGLFGEAQLLLSSRERKRDRIRSCLSLAATPRNYDWMFLSVPDSLFFLYYLIRPLRLLGKYGSKVLKGSDDQVTSTTNAEL